MTAHVRRSPRVSVIVPVFNDAARLGACLDALSAQDYPFRLVDVVVVDNGSTDNPDAVVAGRERVRMVRERQPGSYAARNAGVGLASGDVLAFTDADCLPNPQWLREAVRALWLLGSPGRVGGRVEVFVPDPSRMTAVEAYETVRAFPQRHYVESMGFAATANLVVDARVFSVVGGFDDALRSGGDREWGERATAAGIPLVFSEAAVVRHPARRSWIEMRRKLRRTNAGARDGGRLTTPSGRSAGRGLMPPVSAIRQARHDPRLPNPRARLGYIAASFFVRYVGSFERFRLQHGAPSPR